MATQITWKETSKCTFQETFCVTHLFSTKQYSNSAYKKKQIIERVKEKSWHISPSFLAGNEDDKTCKHETFLYAVFKYGILHIVLKISSYWDIIMKNINPFTATCCYGSDAPRTATVLCTNTDVMHWRWQHCCVPTPLMYSMLLL